jgi:hypothetical protein
VRFHAVLGERFPEIVFIEPVPRDDAPLRAAAARPRAH